jgi:hypothetical protein
MYPWLRPLIIISFLFCGVSLFISFPPVCFKVCLPVSGLAVNYKRAALVSLAFSHVFINVMPYFIILVFILALAAAAAAAAAALAAA